MIDGLSIENFRSFGEEPQRIYSGNKLNIFIGKNNAGKSTILRAIAFFVPVLSKNETVATNPPWDDNVDKSQKSDRSPAFGLFVSKASMAAAREARGPLGDAGPLLDKFVGACRADGLWFYRRKSGNGCEFDVDEDVLGMAERAFGRDQALRQAALGILGTGHNSNRQNARNISELFDPFYKPIDLLPGMPSIIRRVCSGYAPPWGGLQTPSV